MLDWEKEAESRRPMMASVSDVASATSILLGVCLVVLLTLTAICRLLRRGTFYMDQGDRCQGGTGCAPGRGSHAVTAATAEGRCPAKVPDDQSMASVTLTNDRRCSSTSHRFLSLPAVGPCRQ